MEKIMRMSPDEEKKILDLIIKDIERSHEEFENEVPSAPPLTPGGDIPLDAL